MTMLKHSTLFIAFCLFGSLCTQPLNAQNESLLESQPTQYTAATPAHMWEFGLHSGVPIAFGDVDFVPSIGGGFHIRRALDYVFSIRTELLLAKLKNEDTNDGNTETTWQSGTFELIASLNNLVWSSSKNRKTNLYGLVGLGLNRFKVDVKKSISPDISSLDYTTQSHGGVGMGFSVRMLDRFNIGVETKAFILFGKDSDRLDGVNRQDGDIFSYSSLRLNFNLGNKEKRSEPLYWVNPMDMVMQDITELKNRPVFDLTDTDEDGVIDLIDQDNSTPKGVQVDTRGLPLDSDQDGVPDHKDAYPYDKSNGTGDRNNSGSQPTATEKDVERIINERLGEYDRTGRVGQQPQSDNKGGGGGGLSGNNNDGNFGNGNTGNSKRVNYPPSLTNWFLPLIHFEIDSDRLRPADYGTLGSIAKLMREDEGLRIVITGFTDKTASKEYNNELSYRRAKAAVDYLVKTQHINRDRLVLQYNGEDAPLVPSTGSNLMNRRVEFKVATGAESDMLAPSPITSKNSRRKGY